jgi:hypothetical protein
MAKFAIAAPVLPGKDARTVSAVLADRKQEYEESRRRSGITMERAYLMQTPMGDVVTAYIESENSFEQTMQLTATSTLPIDVEFAAKLAEIHGITPEAEGAAPPPEVLGDFVDPAVSERRAGIAFCAPVLPGRTDALRAWAHEAWVARRDAFTASRRALGVNVETVVLNSTPMGDFLCVYIEADDPVAANRGFAASQGEFDVWFKQQLSTLFPPDIDFNQPLPPIEQIWDGVRAPVSAS